MLGCQLKPAGFEQECIKTVSSLRTASCLHGAMRSEVWLRKPAKRPALAPPNNAEVTATKPSRYRDHFVLTSQSIDLIAHKCAIRS